MLDKLYLQMQVAVIVLRIIFFLHLRYCFLDYRIVSLILLGNYLVPLRPEILHVSSSILVYWIYALLDKYESVKASYGR